LQKEGNASLNLIIKKQGHQRFFTEACFIIFSAWLKSTKWGKMYSTNDIRLMLEEKKLINGEAWVNIREPDIEKIKKFIEDKQELTAEEIMALVRINEEDILNIENINLQIVDNNISEREALKQKANIRKNIIYIFVKHIKGTDKFTILRGHDFLNKDTF
jgi:hypothetical protein